MYNIIKLSALLITLLIIASCSRDPASGIGFYVQGYAGASDQFITICCSGDSISVYKFRYGRSVSYIADIDEAKLIIKLMNRSAEKHWPIADVDDGVYDGLELRMSYMHVKNGLKTTYYKNGKNVIFESLFLDLYSTTKKIPD